MAFGATAAFQRLGGARAWSLPALTLSVVVSLSCGDDSSGDQASKASGGAPSTGGGSGSSTNAQAGRNGAAAGGTAGGRGGSAGGAGASMGAGAGRDAGASGGFAAGGVSPTGGSGGGGAEAGAGAAGDAGRANPSGVRGVTNPVVVFDGSETSLDQYGLYHQSQGSTEFVDDPVDGSRQVLRFVHPKADEDWTHEMVRLTDKRTGYEDAAQVTEWETAYHYRQEMYVPNDPQYSRDFVNLLEDFHCEPCEANNLQLYTSYVAEDSVCIWVAYSTDEAFDPRGPERGGSTDPWETLGGDNRLELWLRPDGTPELPATMPPTASLLLCRDDLAVSDLFERWVTVEILVKVSSFDTGVIKFWIDDKPFFYDGPNGYRYNQTGDGSDDALPVNVFQWGLYMGATDVMAGTPDDWVLYATPPLLELGDDVVHAP